MKKLLALILCVVMVLSFSATAFAATPDPEAVKAAAAELAAAKKAQKAIEDDQTKAGDALTAAEAERAAIPVAAKKTAYDSAVAAYAADPTPAKEEALIKAEAEYNSCKNAFEAQNAKCVDLAATYDALAAENKIAKQEVAVAQAELTYAQNPTAANKAAVDAEKAVLDAMTEEEPVVIYTAADVAAACKAAIAEGKAAAAVATAAYDVMKAEIVADAFAARNAAGMRVIDDCEAIGDLIIANSLAQVAVEGALIDAAIEAYYETTFPGLVG